jgi:hypothetical protein
MFQTSNPFAHSFYFEQKAYDSELLDFFTFSIYGILGTIKHDVSETGYVSVLRCGGKTSTQLGPLDCPVIEVSDGLITHPRSPTDTLIKSS